MKMIMPSLSGLGSSGRVGEDDKYATKTIKELRWSGVFTGIPSQLYVGFLIVAVLGYLHLGGSFSQASSTILINYVSCVFEVVGLLMLQHKIKARGNVEGISGNSMLMYATSYITRQYFLAPPQRSLLYLDDWLAELLQVPTLLLVLDVCRSVFFTYRGSYHAEQDPMKAWYLIPAFMVLALPLHASLEDGRVFSYLWSCYMYVDVLALLPQVVLMAKAGGKVEAPIAHFVAATTVSRIVDLWFWSFMYDRLGPQAYWLGFNFSGYLVVTMQLVGIAIIADFMYYYIRARLAGSKLSDDLVLPEDDMC